MREPELRSFKVGVRNIHEAYTISTVVDAPDPDYACDDALTYFMEVDKVEPKDLQICYVEEIK